MKQYLLLFFCYSAVYCSSIKIRQSNQCSEPSLPSYCFDNGDLGVFCSSSACLDPVIEFYKCEGSSESESLRVGCTLNANNQYCLDVVVKHQLNITLSCAFSQGCSSANCLSSVTEFTKSAGCCIASYKGLQNNSLPESFIAISPYLDSCNATYESEPCPNSGAPILLSALAVVLLAVTSVVFQ